jgi:hypothetical protein
MPVLARRLTGGFMPEMPGSGNWSRQLPIAAWAAWEQEPGLQAASWPETDFVDPLLRRRLSRLARMTLHVAQKCVGDRRSLRMVFASRHGELNPTMAMLRALAQNDTVSPAAFSLSVHNAAAGIFSIVRKNREAATAIAAGEETLGYALLEAACQFDQNPKAPVLVVYGDEPLPQEYGHFSSIPGHHHAIAVLFEETGSRTCRLVRGDPAKNSDELQSSAFLRHLKTGETVRWGCGSSTWTWN